MLIFQKILNYIKYETQKINVNSAHHQSEKVGKDLNVSCAANDGVIEGIEHKKHKWCIGLQWHPVFNYKI